MNDRRIEIDKIGDNFVLKVWGIEGVEHWVTLSKGEVRKIKRLLGEFSDY